MRKFLLCLGCIFLQSCIGGSLLVSHEGIQLSSKYNSYVRPPDFESFLNGYSTANLKDPGNPLHLENGGIEVKSNCYKERLVSFSPSVIIPFPPLFPAFGSGEGTVNNNIEITVIAKNDTAASVESISTNNKIYAPIEIKNNIYFFDIPCKKIDSDGVVHLKGSKNSYKIKIKFIKTYNFGWMWLSA